MKICVMGAGGLGGFFGALLAEGGAEVSFVARGAHLEAMRANGLAVKSALGDRLIRPVEATDDPATIGPVDVVLFCVKTYDLEQAAERCRPLLHDDTAVVSLLNGVEAPDRLAQILGPGHPVAGMTFVPSNIAAPGVIEHTGPTATITFGEADGRESARLLAFREACRAGGIDATLSDDIEAALWTKFVAWCAGSGITAVSRQTFGGIQRFAELRASFADVLREAVAVAGAKGVALPDGVVDNIMAMLDGFPPGAKNSTMVDLENGKQLEIDAGVGSVVRLGEALGVATPVCRTIYAALKPFAAGR